MGSLCGHGAVGGIQSRGQAANGTGHAAATVTHAGFQHRGYQRQPSAEARVPPNAT